MKSFRFLFSVVISLALLSLFSCGEGVIDDDDEVLVEGRIMVSPETPYTDKMVFLHRESTLWESFTDELFFAWYWLDCFFDEAENDGSCGAWQTTRSDTSGRYAFTFTGKNTTNELDQLLDFQISAVRGNFSENEITLMTFTVRRESLEFPDLYFWNEPPPADYSPTHVTFDWEGAPVYGEHPADATDFVFVQGHWEAFVDFMDGFRVWEVTASDGQVLELDARIFQDQLVSYRATDHLSRNDLSTTVKIERTSPTGFMEPQSHVPLSRGAACIYTTNLGTRTEQPCALADGDFATFFQGDEKICEELPDDGGCVEPATEDVVVELDDVTTDPTIFLHEFGGNVANQLTMAVSEDGVDYTEVTGDVTSFSVHEVTGNVKYIRFRREMEAGLWAGGMLHFLGEIGVY